MPGSASAPVLLFCFAIALASAAPRLNAKAAAFARQSALWSGAQFGAGRRRFIERTASCFFFCLFVLFPLVVRFFFVGRRRVCRVAFVPRCGQVSAHLHTSGADSSSVHIGSCVVSTLPATLSETKADDGRARCVTAARIRVTTPDRARYGSIGVEAAHRGALFFFCIWIAIRIGKERGRFETSPRCRPLFTCAAAAAAAA